MTPHFSPKPAACSLQPHDAAAKELVAIAHGDGSKRSAASAACRKLIDAFNALVVG